MTAELKPRKTKQPESIEVGGVRFVASEVDVVVIKRSGRDIHISKSEEDEKVKGFAQ